MPDEEHTCTCPAYHYPHQEGEGLCKMPDDCEGIFKLCHSCSFQDDCKILEMIHEGAENENRI